MRVAVVSDIHSNLAALKAVFADAGEVDETWCLGDIVGYGPQPNECIELLRQREPHVLCIAGNHDWAALLRVDTAEFNPDAARAALWTHEQLTPANRAYLENLAEHLSRDDFTLVHGTPRNPIWEYLLSTVTARENFGLLTTSYCLIGHSHVPFIIEEKPESPNGPEVHAPLFGKPMPLPEHRAFINPGSVGQPRDGDPDASYLILDTEAKTIEYRRVSYNIKETQRLMKQAGLPQRLIVRLDYGW